MTRRLSPLTASIRRLGAEYMTRSEAAAVLGISESQLRRINLPGVPGRYAPFGELQVGLYDDTDLVKIRNHLSDQGALIPATDVRKRSRGGAPKRWTASQMQKRNRLRQAIVYHRKQAKAHADTDPARADHHKARVDQAQEELDSMISIPEKRRQRRDKEN